jgi:hypothetical protein
MKKSEPKHQNSERLTNHQYFKDLDYITPEHHIIEGSILFSYYSCSYYVVQRIVAGNSEPLLELRTSITKPLYYGDEEQPFPTMKGFKFTGAVLLVSVGYAQKFQLVGHTHYGLEVFKRMVNTA